MNQDLKVRYRAYIACLNKRDWAKLSDFVAEDVRYNDEVFGLSKYRAMLVADVRDIPDLTFTIRMLIVEAPIVAARLWFDCTPIDSFMGLTVDRRPISFAENVYYEFGADAKITAVWSAVDKAAIEAQLATSS